MKKICKVCDSVHGIKSNQRWSFLEKVSIGKDDYGSWTIEVERDRSRRDSYEINFCPDCGKDLRVDLLPVVETTNKDLTLEKIKLLRKLAKMELADSHPSHSDYQVLYYKVNFYDTLITLLLDEN